MTSASLLASSGFAVWCDLDGTILSVAHDSLGLALELTANRPLGLLVEPGSLGKLLDFLVAVKSHEAVSDWELNFRIGGQIETLHCAGVAIGSSLFISGARNRANLWHLYEEMVEIANEQINLVRRLAKDAAEPQQMGPAGMWANTERDDALYDETSRLNNELINLQRDLAKKTVELERLNALKNQFLGMAAHDLRNPLGAILSYSQFVLSSASQRLNKEEQEYLGLISSQADFMLDVVTDLLDITEIESGKLQLDLRATDLVDTIEHVVAIYRPMAASKQIQLVTSVAGPRPLLMLDARRMEQVLSNLLSNAIKYSHAHTAVTMGVAHNQDDVLLSVQDQGQGIPAGEVNRLFQPFATTSVKATGGEKSTGLGLMIVKKVVEAHRGRIWVESNVGSGSTFTVALPKLPDDQPVLAADKVPAADALAHPLRILLAEDNVVNQRVVLKILERMGYRADVVATGVAVLAALREHPYDLILMDIYMPEMDGSETTRHIRSGQPAELQPTIVALTASVSDESRARCLAAGMDAWLEKTTVNRNDGLRRLLADCPTLTERNKMAGPDS